MDEQQPGDHREARQTPIEPSLLDRRMKHLRSSRGQGLDYLLYDPVSPSGESHGRKWLVAGSVMGAGLGLAALAFVLLPGSSGANTPGPPTVELVTTPTVAAAAGKAQSFEATPTRPAATPTIVRPTPPAGEGAVEGPSSWPAPPVAPPLFVSPVRVKPHVNDKFGPSRGGSLVHAGVDVVSLSAAEFDVVSSCDGRVAGADHSQTYADFVVVDCGGSWRTVYAQMAEIGVRAGQDAIAGETVLGRARGFVHFEIRWNDVPANPETYIDFNAPDPTPTPSPSPLPGDTATPSAGAATPTAGTEDGEVPSSTATAVPSPTPRTPTATPTPTPKPTSTPTPKAAKKSPTPPPISY